MYYIYSTKTALEPYLRPGVRVGGFRAKDENDITKQLQQQLGSAIQGRTLVVYFFKQSVKESNVRTYSLRYDSSKKEKSIRGFVDVEQVPFMKYLKYKLSRLWSHNIINDTPKDPAEIHMP